METTIEPSHEELRQAIAAQFWAVFGARPDNDWEAHLPAMETLHETLDEQQRGE